MCMVEIQPLEKPTIACCTEAKTGMKVYTNSPFVQKARANVLETILLNHPLDCPICDQAGECDLQEQSRYYGNDKSRYYNYFKKTQEDKEFNPIIKTIMTRCITCTRCVRFASEIAGIDYLGTLNRGRNTEINSYILELGFLSEISGNVIDLCPVGALNYKGLSSKFRPWEMITIETVDIIDNLGLKIYIDMKNNKPYRIIPKESFSGNSTIISDNTRFLCDHIYQNRIENWHFNINYGVEKYLYFVNFFFSYFIESNMYKRQKIYNIYDKLVNNSLNKNKFKMYKKLFKDIFIFSGIKMERSRFLLLETLFDLQMDWKLTIKYFQYQFFIDSKTDINFLFFLKHYIYLFSNRELFRKITSEEIKKDSLQNFYFFSTDIKLVNNNLITNYNFLNPIILNFETIFSKIKKNCIVLGSNLKQESPVLNTFLKFKIDLDNLNMIHFGSNYNFNFKQSFGNFNLKKIINIIEGKSKTSKILVKSSNDLVIFGQNFLDRFYANYSLSQNLNKINNSIINLFILFDFNIEAVKLLNIKNVNSSLYFFTSFYKYFYSYSHIFNFFVDLEDTISVRKIVLTYKKKRKNFNNVYNIWSNTNWSEIARKEIDFVIPTNSFLTMNKKYLSLEYNILETFNIGELHGPFVNLTDIIYSEYFKVKLPDYLEKNLSSFLLDNSFEISKIKLECKNLGFIKSFKLILKLNIKNFYKKNIYTKNSKTLNECSELYQIKYSNL